MSIKDLLKIREVEQDLELLSDLLDKELSRVEKRNYPLHKRRSGDLITNL